MKKKEDHQVKRIAYRLNAFGLITCLMLSICPVANEASQKPVYVTVAAGKIDRRESIVSFAVPKNFKAKVYGLRDEKGNRLPLQVTAKGQATFVLPELKAGATKRYHLKAIKGDGKAQGVQVIKEGDKLAISSAGRKVLSYQSKT